MQGKWSHTVDANFRSQTAEERAGVGGDLAVASNLKAKAKAKAIIGSFWYKTRFRFKEERGEQST
jgi:hypothetical protein